MWAPPPTKKPHVLKQKHASLLKKKKKPTDLTNICAKRERRPLHLLWHTFLTSTFFVFAVSKTFPGILLHV